MVIKVSFVMVSATRVRALLFMSEMVGVGRLMIF